VDPYLTLKDVRDHWEGSAPCSIMNIVTYLGLIDRCRDSSLLLSGRLELT
jgi:hypothetical protein